MKRIMKYAAVAGTAGMLAIGMSMPSYAAHGRNAAAAVGFGAGVAVGAVAANAANNGYYGPRYDRAGYAYAPGYADGSGYGAYDYAPGPAIPGMRTNCSRSPASINYVPCPSD